MAPKMKKTAFGVGNASSNPNRKLSGAKVNGGEARTKAKVGSRRLSSLRCALENLLRTFIQLGRTSPKAKLVFDPGTSALL